MIMEPVSGFFVPPTEDSVASPKGMELLSSSELGLFELYKGDKSGKFRVYKCLKKEFRGNQVYERLLQKEFEIGYSLQHVNICEFYSYCSLPELGNCIEMEFVDGCSLESLIAHGKMKKESAAKIITQLCDALTYIHSKQVIHRDLKPSNILLTFNGSNVKLIDFGLSDTDYHSVLKTPAGTENYASPELVEGGKVDNRSDIYSLGCIIAAMTDAFGKVVKKCCKRDPNDRYQDAEEVKAAINKEVSWNFIMFVAFVALAALAIALNGGKTRSLFSSPDNNADKAATDTVSVIKRDSVIVIREVAQPQPTKPSETTPAKQPTTKSDTSAIDDLFRQATEMFE